MGSLVLNRLHVIGRKNSGKTTLVVQLVHELRERGYHVATIKHTHHDHELDTPGKDSFRHRQAGSVAVGILSPKMNAVFWPQPDAAATQSTVDSPTSDSADSISMPAVGFVARDATQDRQKYSTFAVLMKDCDLILVEGDWHTAAPKLEVYRSAVRSELMANADPSIWAVVTDDPIAAACPVWPRSDLANLVKQIESRFSLGPNTSEPETSATET